MSDIIDELKKKAGKKKQRIVYPESSDERILKACAQIIQEGLAQPFLVGKKDDIMAKAGELGVDLKGVEIRDPEHDVNFNKYAEEFYNLRKHKGIDLDTAKEEMKEYIHFAAMMVRLGDCDACVTGATHPTADTLRAALQIIKTREGFKTASSYFLMVKDDEKLFYSDCGFVIDPDAEEMAEIAIATNDSAKDYGISPRVAMLSFSTKGSAQHETVEKVMNATKMVKEKRPDIMVDGELQFDAAYVPKVAASKCPDSPLKGKANVFIFPELNAGNICYKVTQRLGGYAALGPILQGLRKPMNDLSRGCSVEDIVNVSAITAVQALKKGD